MNKFKPMKPPPFLRPGSGLRIISPAGNIKGQEVLPAVDWLQSAGFRVELGKHVFGRHFRFSGTDEERLRDLQEALDDPGISAVVCTRGGYGTIRIIDRLDFSGFRKFPKWVVGYSDITALHNRLHGLGYESVHGAMCRLCMNDEGCSVDSLQSLLKILTGAKTIYKWPGHPLNHPGNVTAPITGGNLSLICSLIGTPFDLDTNGKILFIEDIGEYLYHIDRMMTSLRLSGKLTFLAGLVVGQFSDIKDNGEPFGKTVEEVFLDAVKYYDYPVCFRFPAGHGQPNLAIRLGGRYKLQVNNEICSLKIM